MEKIRLIGTVDAKVDTKGRVFLPAIFRKVLCAGENYRLVLRKDIFEQCLVLYTENEWYKRLDELRAKLSIWNKEHQSLFRQYVTDAEWISLDAGGRFLIPKRYLKKANIGQEITFIGMDDTIEIWAKGEHPSEEESSLGEILGNIMNQNEPPC